jgi:hypothetical protein
MKAWPTILLVEERPPTGRCNVCRQNLYGTEAGNARHWQKCGQQHAEDTHEQRHAFDLLKPVDPEWAEFVQHDKRYKPGDTAVDRGQ